MGTAKLAKGLEFIDDRIELPCGTEVEVERTCAEMFCFKVTDLALSGTVELYCEYCGMKVASNRVNPAYIHAGASVIPLLLAFLARVYAAYLEARSREK